MITAAMAKVPQLGPDQIDDLLLGCGLPGGEQGYNMARVVSVLLGWDNVPGATITRYCSSSLQTTRMALHAIRAGEADVIVSAGVETVSRFAKGSSDGLPDTQNPLFADAQARTAQAGEGGAPVWHDPREDDRLPDIYIAMGQTAENVAGMRGVSRQAQDEFGVRSQNLAESPGEWVLGEGHHPGDAAGRLGRGQGRRPASRHHLREGVAAPAGVPAGRDGHRGQLLPAERRRRRGRRHERHEGGRAGHHPAGPDRVDRRHRPVPGDHGPRPGGRVPQASPRPA